MKGFAIGVNLPDALPAMESRLGVLFVIARN